MNDDFIKKAIEGALGAWMQIQRRQEELLREMDELGRQKAKLSVKLISLARLYDDLPEDTYLAQILKDISQMGLTDGVLSVLKASDEPLTTIQVRDHLIRLGFDLSRFKNALSAINTVLTRMPKEQVETSQDEQTGKILYQWKDPSRAPWDQLSTLPAKDVREVLTKAAKSIVGSDKTGNAKRSRKKESSLKN